MFIYFSVMITTKILIRYLRRATRAAVQNEVKTSEEGGKTKSIFKSNNVEYDLKNNNYLSTIARLAVESDVDALKSLNSGESILNENKKFVRKTYTFDEEYLKYRDKLVNEIQNIDKIEVLLDEEIKRPDSKLVEDPNAAPSKIKCGGCGSKFHCNDKTKPGFLSAIKFKDQNALAFMLCLRCELLKKKQKRYLNLVTSEEDYKKNVLDKILKRKDDNTLIILLIDLLDMPNSIYEGWSKLFSNDENRTKPFDVFIIGSKFDLLPNTGPTWKQDVKNCLLKQCADKGIKGEQIKHVQLISAKKGYDIENLIDKLFQFWKYQGKNYYSIFE